MISVASIAELLGCEDIESLLDAGAPTNEYTPEALAIYAAVMEVKPEDRSEDRLTQIVRAVWSEKFGPYFESDLDLRMPSFRRVAEQILAAMREVSPS